MNTESKGIAHIIIQSIHDDFSKELSCLVMPTIANLIPPEVVPRESIKIPSNIKLADPKFYLPCAIDLLIGAEATLSLFSIGRINLREDCDLYLQKTRLGWVIAGDTSLQAPLKFESYVTNLENQLAKFWTIEEVAEIKAKSEEETECEAHFARTVSRDKQRRYIVRLPFRTTIAHIGEQSRLSV